MTNILDATEQFCRAAGQLEKTGMHVDVCHDVRALRQELLREEYREYRVFGEEENDPVQTADGLLDIIVVAWGTLLVYFGPELAKKMAQSVADSNLSKILEDGTVLKREDGKVLKPEGRYIPPRIPELLADFRLTYDAPETNGPI